MYVDDPNCTISEQDLVRAATDCLRWIELNLLPENAAVYERIRTDVGEIVRLSRPDTASEFVTALAWYGETVDDTFSRYLSPATEWLLSSQLADGRRRGAFPFYLSENGASPLIYQNDNAKVILNLLSLYERTHDRRALNAVAVCGDFWLNIQKRRGNYYAMVLKLKRRESYGPCFLLWPMAAMCRLGAVTGESKYTESAYRALALLQKETASDRMRTSFEVCKAEAWRPVSSENYIALLCYSICYRTTSDKVFLNEIHKILPFCESLLLPNGAISNGKNDLKASLNDSDLLCDCVYTLGFGLNALISLYETLKDKKYLTYALRSASFALRTQCKENDPLVDGGWRGSYNVGTLNAEGRCNQRNSLDEGGKYSLYSGWCALPITIGLLRLRAILNDGGDNVLR